MFGSVTDSFAQGILEARAPVSGLSCASTQSHASKRATTSQTSAPLPPTLRELNLIRQETVDDFPRRAELLVCLLRPNSFLRCLKVPGITSDCRNPGEIQNSSCKQSEQTSRDERSAPDQVEVEPSLAQKCKAELTIERPRDQSCDGKIADRVDSGGENAC